MKKLSPSLIHAFVAITLTLTLFSGCSQKSKPEIIAGSTHIERIVQNLSENTIPVRSLIPAAMCPGHYDMRPSDVEAVATCRLMLLHPWQKDLKNFTQLLRAAKVGDERMNLIMAKGNWMLPAVQKQAIERIAAELDAQKLLPHNLLQSRTQQFCASIDQAVEKVQPQLAQIKTQPVAILCNEQQVDFAKWCGFTIAGVYGRPEELSVAKVEELMALSKAQQARVVVDNLQSGDTMVSKSLARDIQAQHAVLSSFPGGFPDTETWEDTFLDNVHRLVEAVNNGKK